MEYRNTNSSLFNFRITDRLKVQLRGAAVMAGIAAVLSLLNTVVNIAGSFLKKKSANDVDYESVDATTRSVETSGVYIFVLCFFVGISLLLFYLLLRFSTQVKSGLNLNNMGSVNKGLASLSAYFVVLGILLIILLALIILVVMVLLSEGAK
jgi:hypothetical protein